MVKKLFALASVTALAGLVSAVGAAGCSETVVESNPTDAGTPDAKAKADVAPGDDDDDDDSTCLSTDPIDATQFPYTKAVKSAGACTTAEAAALSAFFKTKVDAKEDVLVSEWSQEVSATCRACVFSDGAGETWTPIIVKDDKLDNVNRGGCIEILTGNEACGEAYQQVTECRLEACLIKCKTQEEFSACLQDSQAIFAGPCKDSVTKVVDVCGKALDAAETGCKGKDWTFDGPIKVQCVTGGGQVDAGDGGN
ncbi:MAG: hypothetical protein KF764_13790 [Labilithrix sp.]|nr:hypothetical protein [Labilithrix sp.]MBX3225149.1 hypothetical protein [Labilithrix sp.]